VVTLVGLAAALLGLAAALLGLALAGGRAWRRRFTYSASPASPSSPSASSVLEKM